MLSKRRFATVTSSAALALTCISLSAPAAADTLREALVSTYETNPTLQAARANQRATDEDVNINRSQGLPSVNVTATHIEFLRQSANSFTAPSRNLGVNAQLTVPIYSGGAVKNGTRAAKERVSAGQADLRGTESSVFSQTNGTPRSTQAARIISPLMPEKQSKYASAAEEGG